MCHYRVWHSVDSIKMSSKMDIWQNIIFFMSTHFITFCWSDFLCIPWSFPDKRWLLICMQHTRRLTSVQHTKHYSLASNYCAAHKLLLACCTLKLAHVQYKIVDSCAALSYHTCVLTWVTAKIEGHMHVHRTQVST